jgi:hypothetical protein
LKGPDSVDPATGKVIPGKSIGETHLLRDVQVTAPIQAMEGQARMGDPKALQFLQTIAADPAHPGAVAAQEAIERLVAQARVGQ